MEKPHLTIYWKEYMRMRSHMKFKDFVWNPVMVVKSVILVKGNMTSDSDSDFNGIIVCSYRRTVH
jgi:hypothetical protein